MPVKVEFAFVMNRLIAIFFGGPRSPRLAQEAPGRAIA
jgi:hypothetical protein